MVIMVVGLGSMGRRRIRLLRGAYPEISIVGVDMGSIIGDQQQLERREKLKLPLVQVPRHDLFTAG